jgi:hypothetical protein
LFQIRVGSHFVADLQKDEARRDWALDPECYTLAQVANLLRTFLSKEKAAAYAGEVWRDGRTGVGRSAPPP